MFSKIHRFMYHPPHPASSIIIITRVPLLMAFQLIVWFLCSLMQLMRLCLIPSSSTNINHNGHNPPLTSHIMIITLVLLLMTTDDVLAHCLTSLILFYNYERHLASHSLLEKLSQILQQHVTNHLVLSYYVLSYKPTFMIASIIIRQPHWWCCPACLLPNLQNTDFPAFLLS